MINDKNLDSTFDQEVGLEEVPAVALAIAKKTKIRDELVAENYKETKYLLGTPGMKESLIKSMSAGLGEYSDKIDWES